MPSIALAAEFGQATTRGPLTRLLYSFAPKAVRDFCLSSADKGESATKPDKSMQSEIELSGVLSTRSPCSRHFVAKSVWNFLNSSFLPFHKPFRPSFPMLSN